jgi:hypothetical protein
MPQHTIAMNSEAFGELASFQQRMLQAGYPYSVSRTVVYLLMFARKISDEALMVSNIKDPLDRANAYERLIAAAMASRPDPVRRKVRPCRKATPEQRALVVQQIIARLGIENPPRELVDAYLDQGGMNPMIGSKTKHLSDDDTKRLADEMEARSAAEKARQAFEDARSEEKTAPDPLKIDQPSAQGTEP